MDFLPGGEPMTDDLDRTLRALADPTRRRIIDLLSERPHRAGELADGFDISAPAMSRHLRILRESGLIEDERQATDARVRMFRLRREPFDDVSVWLAQVQAFWNEQLDSFKAHVERRTAKRSKR